MPTSFLAKWADNQCAGSNSIPSWAMQLYVKHQLEDISQYESFSEWFNPRKVQFGALDYVDTSVLRQVYRFLLAQVPLPSSIYEQIRCSYYMTQAEMEFPELLARFPDEKLSILRAIATLCTVAMNETEGRVFQTIQALLLKLRNTHMWSGGEKDYALTLAARFGNPHYPMAMFFVNEVRSKCQNYRDRIERMPLGKLIIGEVDKLYEQHCNHGLESIHIARILEGVVSEGRKLPSLLLHFKAVLETDFEEPEIPVVGPIHISLQTLDKWKSQLSFLIYTRQPQIALKLKESKGLVYQSIKREQEDIEEKIEILQDRIDRAVAVKSPQVSERVVCGSTVVVRDVQHKKNLTLRLVDEGLSDIRNNTISVTSPLGVALLGKKENRFVKVSVKGVTVLYKLLSIK